MRTARRAFGVPASAVDGLPVAHEALLLRWGAIAASQSEMSRWSRGREVAGGRRATDRRWSWPGRLWHCFGRHHVVSAIAGLVGPLHREESSVEAVLRRLTIAWSSAPPQRARWCGRSTGRPPIEGRS